MSATASQLAQNDLKFRMLGCRVIDCLRLHVLGEISSLHVIVSSVSCLQQRPYTASPGRRHRMYI